MNTFISRHKVILLSAVFSLLISAIWFGNGLPKATGESGLLFSTINRQFEMTKYTWSDTTIGETPFSFNGSLPLFSVFKVLSTFLPGAYIQALFFGMIIFIGIIGVSLLIKELFPDTEWKFRFFAGLSYVFNPYSIVFIWNRFLYNYTLSYGLIPFLFFLWFVYLRKGQIKILFAFFCISFIFSFAFTGIAYFVIFLIALALLSLGFVVFENNKVAHFRRGLFIGLALILSQLFWILPFFAGNRPGIGQSAPYFSQEGNLHTTIQLSQYYGGILDKLTFIRADMPALSYEGIPWAMWYSTNLVNMVSAIAVVMIGLSVLSLFYFKQHQKLRLGALFVLLLLLINGTSLPLGNFYLLMYKLHPVLEVLRNPYEKSGFLFYLFVFVLWGLMLSLINKKVSKLAGNLIFTVSIVWWLVNAIPIFNGVIFTYKYDVSKDPKTGFSVKVPDYYKEAKENIATNFESRNLALPITGEGITHKWEVGYDGVESYNGLFDKPFISIDTTTGQLPQIAEYIRSSDTRKLFAALPLLNISDIIIRNDLVPPVNTATPGHISRNFSEQSSLKPQYFGGNILESYKLTDELTSPKVFLTQSHKDQNISKFDPLNTPPNGATISRLNKAISSENYLLYPEATFSEVSGASGADYSENQLLQPPHVSIGLSSPLYPIVRLKELLWKEMHSYELSAVASTISFKRLAEIEAILGQGSREKVIKAIAAYREATQPLLAQAKSLVSISGGNRSLWELIFKSHEAILKKYEAKATSEEKEAIMQEHQYLIDTLVSSNVYPVSENKLQDINDTSVHRSIFEVPEDQSYVFNFSSSLPAVTMHPTIQINETVIDLKKFVMKPGQDISFPLSLTKGKNEIRLLIPQKTEELQIADMTLGSLTDSDTKETSWRFDLPEGSGEVVLTFNYKILKGKGPTVTVIQENNKTKPLLVESYPADTYDFDWKEKTLIIPFRDDMGALDIKFESLPTNDCERNNPLDNKCDSKQFREVYDRHSSFIIRNVNVTTKPKVKTYLSVEGRPSAQTTQNIVWEKINPAMYAIDVNEANKQSVLVFLDQYHPGWALYETEELNGTTRKNWDQYSAIELNPQTTFLDSALLALRTFWKKPVYESQHVVTNGYANGWFIDKPGSYILIYRPQRLLIVGYLVTLSACAYLFVKAIKQKKTKTHAKNHK